jgi:hypothetical protein
VYDAQLINGATITTTDYKVGSASMRFIAAQSQYVSIAPFTTGKKGLSFLFWLKVDSIDPVNNFRVFDFANGAGVNNILLGVRDYRLFGYVVENGLVGSGSSLCYLHYLNDNQWRHFAVIVEPTGLWSVYINGVLEGIQSAGYPSPVQRTKNYLGKSQYSQDPYLNGLIDDFIMYNYMVSSSVRKAAYDRAPTGINS